jgi:hypothetical protein
MCLPIPTVQNQEELNDVSNIGFFEDVGKGGAGLRDLSEGVRRFAPGLNGGALPRTPASFTLSAARFAGP